MSTDPSGADAEELDTTGRRLIYALTTVASLLLLIATRALEGDWAWFAATPLRSAWFAFAISMPLSMALLWARRNERRSLFVAIGTISTVTTLAAFTGTAYAPGLHLSSAAVFVSFSNSMLLAWVVAMPFLQGLRDHPRQWDYPTLFHRAWDNLLTVLTGLAFTLLSWLILRLSASLFTLVGLDFLQDLLEQDTFYFPATGLMLGFGLTLGRAHLGALRSVLRICLSFSQVLLPAVSAITVLFAIALLLSDLAPLWDTGHATFLLLSLIFLLVALVNGVYTDGRQQHRYARPVRLVVAFGLLVLPALASIAAYAMSLRVGQYGLTVSRLYGIVAIAFAGMYATSYAIAAVRGLQAHANSLPGLDTINRVLGLLLAVVLVLSQSPGLNFRERTLAYQLGALDLEQDSPGTTDWMYLRFQLGTPGYRAVQDLAMRAQSQGLSALAAHLDGVLATTHPYRDGSQPFALTQWLDKGRVRVVPEGAPLPQELAAQLSALHDELPMLGMPGLCATTDQPCLLLSVELNREPPQEWVFVPPPAQACEYPVLVQVATTWSIAGYLRPEGHCLSPEAYADLTAASWSTQLPAYYNLVTGTADSTVLWQFQQR